MADQDLKESGKTVFSHELAIGQNRINRVLVAVGYDTTLSNLLIIRFSTHLAASILYESSTTRHSDCSRDAPYHGERLKAVLELDGNEIVVSCCANLEALLWIAFVGGAATF
jgi:hypothetical protein